MEGLRHVTQAADAPATIHIGRVSLDKKTSTHNEFVLSYGYGVSSAHAEVRFERGRLFLKDNASTNGTSTRAGQVIGEVEIQPGDVFLVSSTPVRVRFVEAALPEMPFPRVLRGEAWPVPAVQSIVRGAREAATQRGELFTDTRHLCDALLRSRSANIQRILRDANWSREQALAELWEGRLFTGPYEWLNDLFLQPLGLKTGSGELILSPKVGFLLEECQRRTIESSAMDLETTLRLELLKLLRRDEESAVGSWLARRLPELETGDETPRRAPPPVAPRRRRGRSRPRPALSRRRAPGAVRSRPAALPRTSLPARPAAAAPGPPDGGRGRARPEGARARGRPASRERRLPLLDARRPPPGSQVARRPRAPPPRAGQEAARPRAAPPPVSGRRAGRRPERRGEPSSPARGRSGAAARRGDVPAGGRRTEIAPVGAPAVPWRALLSPEDDKGPALEPRLAVLRDVLRFAQDVETFTLGLVEAMTMPGAETANFRLPNFRDRLSGFLAAAAEGKDVSPDDVRDYLAELRRWQVAISAGHHEAPRLWFTRLWKRISPSVIEAGKPGAGWKLRGETAEWWNQYRDLVKDLNPDLVQDQVLQAAAHVSQAEYQKLNRKK